MKAPPMVPLEGVGLDVRSWCPSPDGTGPATQVHLVIPVEPEGVGIVVRLKTAQGVRRLLTAILEHAHDVWPEEFPRGGSR